MLLTLLHSFTGSPREHWLFHIGFFTVWYFAFVFCSFCLKYTHFWRQLNGWYLFLLMREVLVLRVWGGDGKTGWGQVSVTVPDSKTKPVFSLMMQQFQRSHQDGYSLTPAVVLASVRVFREREREMLELGVTSNSCVLLIVMLILLGLATTSTGKPSPWKGRSIFRLSLSNWRLQRLFIFNFNLPGTYQPITTNKEEKKLTKIKSTLRQTTCHS